MYIYIIQLNLGHIVAAFESPDEAFEELRRQQAKFPDQAFSIVRQLLYKAFPELRGARK